MSFIDITICILCIGGLVYFFFERIKYSDIDIYCAKLKMSSDLEKSIKTIEACNKDTLEQIKNADLTEPLDPVFVDRLVSYRDYEEELKILKNTKRKTDKWLKNARSYLKFKIAWSINDERQ